MSLSRRIATLPWPAYTVLTLVVGGLVLGLLRFVYADSPVTDTWPALLGVFAVAGGIASVVAAVRRRRLQEQGRWAAYLDAVDAFQRRQPPRHPAVRAELARLARTQRSTLSILRWGWVLFASQALLAATTSFEHPRHWIMVALFAGPAAAYPGLYRRTRGQVEAAERALA